MKLYIIIKFGKQIYGFDSNLERWLFYWGGIPGDAHKAMRILQTNLLLFNSLLGGERVPYLFCHCETWYFEVVAISSFIFLTPSPLMGEGGVEGENCFQQEPPHPDPLPRWGEGS